jgi:Rhomboid family
MRSCIGGSLEAFQTRLLDRSDLLAHDGLPRQIAPQFLKRMGWKTAPLRCAQPLQALRRLAHKWIEPADAEADVPNVGASGAIAGVLAAYLLMFPGARVNVLVYNQVVAMPAMIVLGLWIVLQLFSGFGSIAATSETTDQGGVAYMAHVARLRRAPIDRGRLRMRS